MFETKVMRGKVAPALGCWLLVACAGEPSSPAGPSDAGTDVRDAGPPPCGRGEVRDDAGVCAPIPAVRPRQGDLLIEELYYSGAAPAGGTDHYFSDQFIELVNASDAPLDLGGVLVADAFGVAGEINPGTSPDGFGDRRPDTVVLNSVWRIPVGARLEPGEQLLVVHDGTNHRPFSTIDLSGADFEAYVPGRDEDHPTVPNLEMVVFNGGFDWLVPVFGASLVILEADTALGTEPGPFGPLPTAPAAAVLDGVEALMDGDSAAFKRLPSQVDRGFNWVSDTYVGESLHRIRSGGTWQDTQDSGADFMVGPPTPSHPELSPAVHGDTWLELGTGTTEFVPLAPGGDVEIVEGIQGGWHIDVAVRFGGFDPDGVRLSYEALDGSGQRVSYETRAELSPRGVLSEPDAWVRVGDRVVLDIRDARDLIGATITLRVTATLDAESWTDERSVQVVDAL
ncbi:MAG: DUF4876 domain-containing protein [Deltaproteobacteria bacterium]